MDLGIAGRWAVVCAASKGLGKGCAEALVKEGVNVVINSRSQEVLERTASELRALAGDVEIKTVAGDITDAAVRTQVLAAAPQVDILINNAGGPPPGDFRDWEPAQWQSALNANMITPIEMIKATVDQMAERGFGRIVNITSSSVKAPIAPLGLSNGARAGLTGFVAGLARQPQLAAHNVTVNNLLPGKFLTERLRNNFEHIAQTSGRTTDEVMSAQQEAIPARRFGSAEEFGLFCAFLCSQPASYFTGQNVLMDGGGYPGTF